MKAKSGTGKSSFPVMNPGDRKRAEFLSRIILEKFDKKAGSEHYFQLTETDFLNKQKVSNLLNNIYQKHAILEKNKLSFEVFNNYSFQEGKSPEGIFTILKKSLATWEGSSPLKIPFQVFGSIKPEEDFNFTNINDIISKFLRASNVNCRLGREYIIANHPSWEDNSRNFLKVLEDENIKYANKDKSTSQIFGCLTYWLVPFKAVGISEFDLTSASLKEYYNFIKDWQKNLIGNFFLDDGSEANLLAKEIIKKSFILEDLLNDTKGGGLSRVLSDMGIVNAYNENLLTVSPQWLKSMTNAEGIFPELRYLHARTTPDWLRDAAGYFLFRELRLPQLLKATFKGANPSDEFIKDLILVDRSYRGVKGLFSLSDSVEAEIILEEEVKKTFGGVNAVDFAEEYLDYAISEQYEKLEDPQRQDMLYAIPTGTIEQPLRSVVHLPLDEASFGGIAKVFNDPTIEFFGANDVHASSRTIHFSLSAANFDNPIRGTIVVGDKVKLNLWLPEKGKFPLLASSVELFTLSVFMKLCEKRHNLDLTQKHRTAQSPSEVAESILSDSRTVPRLDSYYVYSPPDKLEETDEYFGTRSVTVDEHSHRIAYGRKVLIAQRRLQIAEAINASQKLKDQLGLELKDIFFNKMGQVDPEDIKDLPPLIQEKLERVTVDGITKIIQRRLLTHYREIKVRNPEFEAQINKRRKYRVRRPELFGIINVFDEVFK